MLESLKDIKSIQDIKVLKARMRYEALLAENKMLESFRAVEKLVTFVSNVRRASAALHQAYRVFSKIGAFFGRLFGKTEEGKAPEEETKKY